MNPPPTFLLLLLLLLSGRSQGQVAQLAALFPLGSPLLLACSLTRDLLSLPTSSFSSQGDLKDKWRNWQRNVANGWTTARVYMPDELKQRIEKLVQDYNMQV
jgi:hypothetical protein